MKTADHFSGQSGQRAEALRITVVNAAYDGSVVDCDALLDTYDTLTDWCDALGSAGAEVRVVQRFSQDAVRRRGYTEFTFVADGGPSTPSAGAGMRRVVDVVAATGPALVHVNGLGFPGLLRALRQALPPEIVLVVQDHAGVRIPAGRGPLRSWQRARWRSGLSAVDAISFSAAAQAQPWRDAGLIDAQPVLAVIESSTRIQPTPRSLARSRVGLDGRPLVLWVGRLIPGKDPLTIVTAFDQVVSRHPSARLALVFQDRTLERDVIAAVEASPRLRPTVTLVGRVSRETLADWYGAADVLVSGSHAEGSGYALIEGMACGLVPVVTAIPSFQAIAGPCGLFWPPGDASACADALIQLCELDLRTASDAVRERFARELAWPVIAARTLAAYRALVAGRAGRGTIS